MSQADAITIRLPFVEGFLPYMRAVWQATEEYLNSITDDDLQTMFAIRPIGERPAVQVLIENLLTHGFSHLGGVWILSGLQGFKGSPV